MKKSIYFLVVVNLIVLFLLFFNPLKRENPPQPSPLPQELAQMGSPTEKVKVPAETKEPAAVEVPAETKESAAAEVPAETEESAAAEVPAETKESAAAEVPAETEESVNSYQGLFTIINDNFDQTDFRKTYQQLSQFPATFQSALEFWVQLDFETIRQAVGKIICDDIFANANLESLRLFLVKFIGVGERKVFPLQNNLGECIIEAQDEYHFTLSVGDKKVTFEFQEHKLLGFDSSDSSSGEKIEIVENISKIARGVISWDFIDMNKGYVRPTVYLFADSRELMIGEQYSQNDTKILFRFGINPINSSFFIDKVGLLTFLKSNDLKFLQISKSIPFLPDYALLDIDTDELLVSLKHYNSGELAGSLGVIEEGGLKGMRLVLGADPDEDGMTFLFDNSSSSIKARIIENGRPQEFIIRFNHDNISVDQMLESTDSGGGKRQLALVGVYSLHADTQTKRISLKEQDTEIGSITLIPETESFEIRLPGQTEPLVIK